jgi:hypothetical protein
MTNRPVPPRRVFNPRPWQPAMIDFAISKKRGNLLAKMGVGKSSAMLSVIDTLISTGEVRKVLVIAPLRVARATWPDEVRRWTQFESLIVQPVTGMLNHRKAAMKNTEAHIFTINYDILPWLVEFLGRKWDFDMVVADEATKLKNHRLKQGGQRARVLSHVAFWDNKTPTAARVERWINLSGTFSPNGLTDLWGPMWFIDQGERLGRSYSAFENRWFGYQRAKDAVNPHVTRIKRVPFPHSFKEITSAIEDVTISFNPKDWMEIKDPIVVRVYVDLPPTVKFTYRQMEREMFAQIAGYDIEAFAASGKIIKTLQLANGAIYTGSDEEIESDVSHWVEAHQEKLMALGEIIEEAQRDPVLVVYHFKPDLIRLKAKFPEGRHIHTKQDEDDFKAGLIEVAFVHASSIGHGVDGFQNVCNIIVFFALWWDLETHDQIIERIGPMRQMQAGFDREVMVYLILARDTVDELVDRRLIMKRQTQDATFDSFAYKPPEEEQLW